MRLFGVVDGTIDRRDRAGWLSAPFDGAWSVLGYRLLDVPGRIPVGYPVPVTVMPSGGALVGTVNLAASGGTLSPSSLTFAGPDPQVARLVAPHSGAVTIVATNTAGVSDPAPLVLDAFVPAFAPTPIRFARSGIGMS